jgi:hypothetical protein
MPQIVVRFLSNRLWQAEHGMGLFVHHSEFASNGKNQIDAVLSPGQGKTRGGAAGKDQGSDFLVS